MNYILGSREYFREGNGTPLQYSCLEIPMDGGAWKAAVHGVTEGRAGLSDFTFTFHFHALEKEMATHSSVLAWRIPGMGEPGALPSMGSHRVGHDWSDLAAENTYNLNNVKIIIFLIYVPNVELGDGLQSLLGNQTSVHINVDSGWWRFSHSVMSDSCDPMDCSLPGSSVHGIFQARILEWVAISFSKRSPWPRNWIRISCTAGRYFTEWAMR